LSFRQTGLAGCLEFLWGKNTDSLVTVKNNLVFSNITKYLQGFENHRA